MLSTMTMLRVAVILLLQCNSGCALSKIIRAVQLKTAEVAKTGIVAGSVRDDGELLKSFREFVAESDYEYFGKLIFA